MDPHVDLVRSFYAAFQRRDHRAMAACYAPDAEFHDPVFTDLAGWRVGAMWRMLCERATDLRIELPSVHALPPRRSRRTGKPGTPSPRPVGRCTIAWTASFLFRDGKIHRHTDVFDLYAWARQALGMKGLLLGWAPPVQRAIRAQAARALNAYIEKHPTTP